MAAAGSLALESRVPFLGPAFRDAGLTDHEANIFLQLCRDTIALPSYGYLQAENRHLARAHPKRIDILPLGYSSDYPADSATPRGIEALVIHADSKKRGNSSAVFEAPQHPTEYIGIATAANQKRLHTMFPGIMRRMGYDKVAVSDHANPDLMLLQQWARLYKPTIRDFILGGVRGDQHAQLSWSYPTATFEGSREAHASLALYRQLLPAYIGSLHNSVAATFQVVSPNFPATPGDAIDPLVQLLERFEMAVTYNWADPGIRPISPGLFSMGPPGTYGGANILDHKQPDAVFHAPEIAMLQYNEVDNELSGMTAAEALIARHESILPRLGSIASRLEDLNLTEEQLAGSREADRLHKAALYWTGRVGAIKASANTIIGFLPPKVANRQLTVTEVRQTAAATIINSLVGLGNVHRLALMYGKLDLARKIEQQIDHEIQRDVGPVKIAPLDLLICAQSLSVLIAMRRVAAASGLC